MKNMVPKRVFSRQAFAALLSGVIAVTVTGCVFNRPDYTIGESGNCEVHHIAMKRTLVPIYYGLPAITLNAEWTKAHYEAETNTFPHAETHVQGGCIVGWSSPRHARVYVCPLCVKAADDWNAVHTK